MRKMHMCPMMANMSMMPMMHAPMSQMPMAQMPMGQMPMMMNADMCDMEHEEDEKDEEYFAGMHSEACHKMMPYVNKVLDKKEQKSNGMYEGYPKKEMLDEMTEEAYKSMIKDMPEMADEAEEERQYFGPRRFGRDLLGVLLINELLRRRRRRRRYGHDYDEFGYGPYDYNDLYYYD